MIKLSFLILCIGLGCCLPFSASAKGETAGQEVLQVFIDFAKAVNTGNLELLSSLYRHSDKTSQFIDAAGMPFLYQGWETIENNWKPFFTYLKSSEGSTSVSIHNPQATILDDNVAVITGYHNLVSSDPTTKEETMSQIRISFVVQKIEGRWLIVHEHASAFPLK